MKWDGKKLIIAAMLATSVANVSADKLQLNLEIGAYYNLDLNEQKHPWVDGGSPVAAFRLKLQKGRATCEYAHISNWFTGAPFNDTPESTLDMVGCSYSINLLGG